MEHIKIDFEKKSGFIRCSSNILKLIREKFSIKNPSYQMSRFVPRLYAVTPAGAFQVGLWNEIKNYIGSLNIPVKIEISEEFSKNYKPKLEIKEISKIDGFDYYDYQIDTLNEFVANGRGIGLLATGAGKALIIGGLCKTLLDYKPNSKILVVVPNVGLLNQLHNSFLNEFNIDDVTVWGDKKLPDLNKHVLIANTQILTSDVKSTLKIVENYDYVIVDEVHTINDKKNKISKVIHNIHTPFKFGLTATLPDNIMACWNVMGKIGPILYEKNSYELRKQQTISDVEIKVVVCSHNPKPFFPKGDNPTDAYNAEFDYIINCKQRNDVIKKIVEKLEGNTIIVVDRRDYIDSLEKVLKDCGKTVYIITGDTPTEERTMIQNELDSRDGIIGVVMSKCFSTGISVKNIHYAVFAYMGKGGVKTVQTIGRTVRKHHSKQKAIIFDVADDLLYSLSHLRKRLEIYKKQKIEYTLKKIKI